MFFILLSFIFSARPHKKRIFKRIYDPQENKKAQYTIAQKGVCPVGTRIAYETMQMCGFCRPEVVAICIPL